MNEISHILTIPEVQESLQHIDRTWRRVVDEAVDIQQTPAPTFSEKERSGKMCNLFQALALSDVHQDEILNVYARIPGEYSEMPVVVSAHLDTVFEADTDLTVQRRDGRVYGPGICDNSLGLAGLLALGRQLKECRLSLERDIWLVANVGEEGLGDLRGMKAVAERFGSRATYLVVEGGLYGYIFHGAIGVRRFEVTIRAPGGHSWGNFGAQSAIHVLGRIIARISRMSVSREPKSTFNVGLIEGGTSVNSIAQQASMLVDLRSEDADSLEQLVGRFQAIVREQTRHPDVQAVMTLVGNRPAGRIARRAPLVSLAVEALNAVGCDEVKFDVGSTDANIPLSKGWQAVCIGLTKSNNAHRLDEYMETGPLKRGLAQLFLLSLAVAGIRM